MHQNKRLTIRDIAKTAGVSPATISLALNNKGNLSDERRKEIRELATKMGYIPSPMARALRGAGTGCIGLVINYFNNPFYPAFYAGMETATAENNLHFTVSQSLDSLEREQSQARLLAELGMDGLIVLPCGNVSAHLEEIQRCYNIPIVVAGHILSSAFAGVESDNLRGARMVAEHFLDLGKRTNLHLAGPQGKSALANRKQAFCEVMLARDPDFNPETHVFYTDSLTAEGGYAMMSVINSRHKFPYSLFAVNDVVALGALHYCRQHGIRVPEDVAIAGFSNIDILEAYGISLTTVHMPAKRIAETAVELLLEMKRNEKAREYPPTMTLPVSLVIRHSTAGATQNDNVFFQHYS